MNTIEIKGQIFPYEPKELTYEGSAILDKKIAKENLLLFKKVLDNKGCEFQLAFGTLLGAVRDKDFIDHDTDIDVMSIDEERLLTCIQPLWEEGLRFCRYSSSGTYSFIKENVYIDVYVIRKVRFPLSFAYCQYAGALYPKRLIKKTQDYPFLGVTFKVPLKLEQNFVHVYGKNWRIPIQGDYGNIESSKIRFFRKYFGRIAFLKKILKRFIK